eukprot:scaffold20743_cov17-Tisochrysis_lutea.AAC.1
MEARGTHPNLGWVLRDGICQSRHAKAEMLDTAERGGPACMKTQEMHLSRAYLGNCNVQVQLAGSIERSACRIAKLDTAERGGRCSKLNREINVLKCTVQMQLARTLERSTHSLQGCNYNVQMQLAAACGLHQEANLHTFLPCASSGGIKTSELTAAVQGGVAERVHRKEYSSQKRAGCTSRKGLPNFLAIHRRACGLSHMLFTESPAFSSHTKVHKNTQVHTHHGWGEGGGVQQGGGLVRGVGAGHQSLHRCLGWRLLLLVLLQDAGSSSIHSGWGGASCAHDGVDGGGLRTWHVCPHISALTQHMLAVPKSHAWECVRACMR